MQEERDVALARVAELERTREPTSSQTITQYFVAGSQCLNVNVNVWPPAAPTPAPAVPTLTNLAYRPAKPLKPPKYNDRCSREAEESNYYSGSCPYIHENQMEAYKDLIPTLPCNKVTEDQVMKMEE